MIPGEERGMGPSEKLPEDYENFIRTLADPRLSVEDSTEAAWRYYRAAGCPYGETKKGLALWIERLTGTTSN